MKKGRIYSYLLTDPGPASFYNVELLMKDEHTTSVCMSCWSTQAVALKVADRRLCTRPRRFRGCRGQVRQQFSEFMP